MGKQKKTGNVPSTANRTKSQAAGRTRMTARFGIAQIALPSIIPLHVAEPFWSLAHKAWRIEATVYEGPLFEQQWQHSIFFEEEFKASEAYNDLKHCRTREEWIERVSKLRIRDVR